MEALGRLFNVLSLGDAKYVNLRDCGGVTFMCYLAAAAGDTWTLQEATTAAGGGATNLVTITRFHTCTGDGTDAWTLRTQAAAATVVTAAAATQNAMVVEVEAEELSAGFSYVKLTSTGAGLVTAVTRDLRVARKPSNLAVISA